MNNAIVSLFCIEYYDKYICYYHKHVHIEDILNRLPVKDCRNPFFKSTATTSDNIPQITPSTAKKISGSKDIWDNDTVPVGVPEIEHEETRPQPEYDIRFKQNVATEDIFLGFVGHCIHLLFSIQMSFVN